MEDILEAEKTYFLDDCDAIWQRMETLDEEYAKRRHGLKTELAEKIEEGKLKADLQVTAVARRVGVTRQTIHRVLIDVYGIRHFDKAKAGSLGHKPKVEQ